VTRYPLYQVDAFADGPFTGNPAAVVPLEEWLPDDVLQAVAMENNLSETAFTIPAQNGADYELRWFTPAIEVVLCGHATLASAHVLMDGERIRFRTRHSGILDIARNGDGYAMSLPSLPADPKPLPNVLTTLGCEARETYWHRDGYALVVLDSEAAVRTVQPDFRKLADEGNVLTIVTAPGERTDVVSRAFAPGAGIDEDPVTGTAHAVMLPYWSARLGRDHFTAYQASRRGGHVDCRLDGDRAILGGKCVTVIEGELRL
jgi:predicted PhzF superfamily epimerase YddE/YHI9